MSAQAWRAPRGGAAASLPASRPRRRAAALSVAACARADAKSRSRPPAKLPDNAFWLLPPLGSGASPVALIGTVHVSEKSAADVTALITQLKPRAVCVELCGERLHYELPRQPSRWRFARVTLRGVPQRPVPGHPDASELLARLTCQPGASVTQADVAADLRLLARTGLFADVAAAVRAPRRVFSCCGGSALQAEAEAEALILSVTPRQLQPFGSYVVALAPELRDKYPPAGGDGRKADASPHLPWLPAFHATFAALMEEASAQRAGRDLTGLEMCCVAREAVARAGRAHTTAAGVASDELAVAPRCERDPSRPDSLVVSLEPPPPRASGDAPGSDGDAWDAAGAAALREDGGERRAAKAAAAAAAAALQLPSLPPRKAPRRHRGAAAMLARLDGAASAAITAVGFITQELIAWKLGVRVGCDVHAGLNAAADVGALQVFCIDRSHRITARRLGTLLRRTVGAKIVAAAAAAAATARLVPTYWPLVLLAVAAAWYAYATLEFRRRVAAAGVTAFEYRLRMVQRHVAPLVRERDVIMAAALRRIASAAPPSHLARLHGVSEGAARAGLPPIRYTLLQRATAGDTHDDYKAHQQAVVAVVGLGHVRGIHAAWHAGWRRWKRERKMRAAFAARWARLEDAGGRSRVRKFLASADAWQ